MKDKNKKDKNKDGENNKNNFKVGLASNFSDEDFFDDCAICQMMKRAKEIGKEPTLDEIKEAYKKAEKQGGIVGGELLK